MHKRTTTFRKHVSKVQSKLRTLTSDPHHRLHSWTHCHDHFRRARRAHLLNPRLSKNEIESAALHLGFYLASWGMYRGRSFLLWKDYKIHRYAVRIIMRPAHHDLWDIRISKLNDEKINRIVDLSKELKLIYPKKVKMVNGKRKSVRVTDTLVTKILLGTLCCTPAYDRNFKQTASKYGLCKAFGEKGLKNLRTWFTEQKGPRGFKRNGCFKGMPDMKFIDTCFWF